MTEKGATGYDGLLSRLIPEIELRTFLLDCFQIYGHELFVSHEDRVADGLRDLPQELVFAAFCTWQQVSGHFAMSLSVGIDGRLADRVGRREFAERITARFDAYMLYGDTEPPGVWTMTLPDGTHQLAAMNEEDDRILLYSATAPVPGLPEVPVSEELWQQR